MIYFKCDNIINSNSECIVNSTNKYLEWEETTVNGDIQNSGGIELINHLKMIISHKKELQISEPILSNGYNLKSKYIIHVVSPHWIVNNNVNLTLALLTQSYRNCLLLAIENNIKSISFPLLGSGAFRIPFDIACKTAFLECDKYSNDIYIDFYIKNINKMIKMNKIYEIK